ncbi:hypothetical protein CRE_30975 [Caenorhabditis remanei]|uniref:Solute-binding protein family 3/N-terminal domain-containing protein n=1 Tax=Caenorhabditis remanei TaxID=31234 RepID=E3LTW0_CAERE|nr:hypothetical protein CRE_30975 [Caenorhabditis remanei]
MSWSPIGRPIRVGVFEFQPDAFNCFRDLPQKPCAKPGSEMEIISMVMKILDWQWEVIDTEKEFDVTRDFGHLQPDGNFSGIMGLLANDKIDMCGLSLAISQDRMGFAHFTFPTRYYQQVYIIRNPPENDFRNFVFAPFTTQMWLLLLASAMGVSTMRFICALYFDYRIGSKLSIYTSSLLETFGFMVNQGAQSSNGIPIMFLQGSLIASIMVITQYYQTFMNSLLTAPPSSHIPFYHQNELIELLLKKQTYLTYYLNVSLEATTDENEVNLKRAMVHNPLVIRDTEEELDAEMHKGGVFYSTDDVELLPAVVSVWEKEKGLIAIRDTTSIRSLTGFAFSISNKKLCKMFNKALLRILPGIPTIMSGPGYGTKKQAEDVTVQVKKIKLSMKTHLEQLFLIWIIGCAIAVLVFVIEKVFYRVKDLRRQKVS